MQKTAPHFRNSEAANNVSAFSVPVKDLENHIQDWLYESDFRQNTQRTLGEKRAIAGRLLWFLEHENLAVCGVSELRQFLAYVGNGHKEKGGRWGNPHQTRPVRPTTVQTYYRYLSSLFTWMKEDEVLPESPFSRIRPPKVQADQIRPFEPEQLKALLVAARRSTHPKRNEAILVFLLDTGIRATELCELRMKNLDLAQKRCTVMGKGNKQRTLYIGRDCSKALWQYLREQPRDEDEFVFVSDRGTRAGAPLTRSGLLQLIQRLGDASRIQNVRCSPHTFRHTFAVEFLRAGGNVFTLKELLGHTNLQITQRYVALAEADLAAQHRAYSPVDRLMR